MYQKDDASAAMLYGIIVQDIIDNYGSFRWHGDEGELDEVVKDCVKDLGVCLREEKRDVSVRQNIIRTLRDEAFQQACEESGNYTYLVERLLTRNRVDEAMDAARQAEDYDLIEIANIFIDSGYEERAEQLIKERSASSAKTPYASNSELLTWLKNRYEARNDTARALDTIHTSPCKYARRRGHHSLRPGTVYVCSQGVMNDGPYVGLLRAHT